MTPVSRDWDGFLPVQTCRSCGATLRGQGSGYPAELYAGTFTGLCYPCTAKGPTIIGQDPFTGLDRVSWPPACPSHRRDRETFYACPGCPSCDGKGARTQSGYGPLGTYHYVQCSRCATLAWWRERLRDYRRDRRAEIDRRLDELVKETEAWRKRVRLDPGEASVRVFRAQAAEEYRALLREAWAGV